MHISPCLWYKQMFIQMFGWTFHVSKKTSTLRKVKANILFLTTLLLLQNFLFIFNSFQVDFILFIFTTYILKLTWNFGAVKLTNNFSKIRLMQQLHQIQIWWFIEFHYFPGLDIQGNILKAEMSVGSDKRRYDWSKTHKFLG